MLWILEYMWRLTELINPHRCENPHQKLCDTVASVPKYGWDIEGFVHRECAWSPSAFEVTLISLSWQVLYLDTDNGGPVSTARFSWIVCNTHSQGLTFHTNSRRNRCVHQYNSLHLISFSYSTWCQAFLWTQLTNQIPNTGNFMNFLSPYIAAVLRAMSAMGLCWANAYGDHHQIYLV